MTETTKRKHRGSDKCVVFVMEAILLSVFVLVVYKDLFREADGTTVTRGEKSLAFLYNFMTGIVLFVYTLAIQLSVAFKGNKVLIFILNSGAIIYLFFFSSWFRNIIFSPLMKRITTD